MQTIKEHRETAGLTQFELALAVGVKPNTISAWETGRKEPRAVHLQAIARALGVSADDIDLSAFEGKAAA
jgi:transcriptional regulator with XRE-family HTH domain